MRSKTESSNKIWTENEKEEEKEEKSDKHELRLTRRNTVWWEVARTLAPADHRASRRTTYMNVCAYALSRISIQLLSTLNQPFQRLHARTCSLASLFSSFPLSTLLPSFFLPSFLSSFHFSFFSHKYR